MQVIEKVKVVPEGYNGAGMDGMYANGNITISIPFINKGIMFNQSDLETFRQLLTK